MIYQSSRFILGFTEVPRGTPYDGLYVEAEPKGLVIDSYLIANRKNTKGVVFLSKTVYKTVKKKFVEGNLCPRDRGSRVTPVIPINFSKR